MACASWRGPAYLTAGNTAALLLCSAQRCVWLWPSVLGPALALPSARSPFPFLPLLLPLGPQVIKHGNFSPASDVYAFGLIMWELITWDVPFADMSQFQVCTRSPLFCGRELLQHLLRAKCCWPLGARRLAALLCRARCASPWPPSTSAATQPIPPPADHDGCDAQRPAPRDPRPVQQQAARGDVSAVPAGKLHRAALGWAGLGSACAAAACSTAGSLRKGWCAKQRLIDEKNALHCGYRCCSTATSCGGAGMRTPTSGPALTR